MRRIIGIGETVLDVIFHDDKPTAAVPGGSTFNALVSLGRTIGVEYNGLIPIKMVTEVGDDHIGDIVVDFMKQNNIATGWVVRNKDTQTHISMAFLDKNNDAQYEFYKDHAHANMESFSTSHVEFTAEDIVLFGSYFAINPVIRHITLPLIRQAHEAGAIVYYDINFRKSHLKELPEVMENIRENCRLSDIVRGSADDFMYLFGLTNAAEIYEKYIRELCPNFIFTNGGDSIETFSEGCHSTFKPLRCKTVSTIGAGDNFNAGILYSIVRYGFFKDDVNSPLNFNAAAWKLLVGIAKHFSAAVCRSINNYVDVGFKV